MSASGFRRRMGRAVVADGHPLHRRYPQNAPAGASGSRHRCGNSLATTRGWLANREKTLLFSVVAYAPISQPKILILRDSASPVPSSSESGANLSLAGIRLPTSRSRRQYERLFGADTTRLDAAGIAARFPFLAVPDGAGGLYEGHAGYVS